MNKKVILIIVSIFFVIVMTCSLSVVEYYYAKKDNRIPLISLINENKSKQYYEYNALFYKVYKCYSNDIYMSSYKSASPTCPYVIKFDKKNNFTTSNGVSISKKDYQMLLTTYTYKEIDLFNSENVNDMLLISKIYNSSLYSLANINTNSFTIDSQKVSVIAFNEFVINDNYGNYSWVSQVNDINYYECLKTEKDTNKLLFSDYTSGECTNNWHYYDYGEKWCSLASSSNKQEILEVYNNYCK